MSGRKKQKRALVFVYLLYYVHIWTYDMAYFPAKGKAQGKEREREA
jgi:hypothetical protein